MREPVFTITNELTGLRVDVHQRGPATFEVVLEDVDCHDYLSAFFRRESEAINHAIRCS